MPRSTPGGRDAVASILALGVALALNMLMLGIVWDAVRSDTPGLSENATQVITALGSGVIGVLGGYIGGRAAEHASQQATEAERARVEASTIAVEPVEPDDDEPDRT